MSSTAGSNKFIFAGPAAYFGGLFRKLAIEKDDDNNCSNIYAFV